MAKCIYFLEWKNFEGMGKLCSKSEEAGAEKSEPGTVVKTDKKGIYVACGEDVLVLSQVQLEGKREWMRMHSFEDVI